MRPTDPTRRPDERLAKKLTADQFKLYELIWKRFMASQMSPAVFDTTTVDFDIAAAGQGEVSLDRAETIMRGDPSCTFRYKFAPR